MLGSNLCGHSSLQAPKIDRSIHIFSGNNSITQNHIQQENTALTTTKHIPLCKALYTLIQKRTEVITDQSSEVEVQGTLGNIMEYGDKLFNGDKHQVTAFAYIVSTFVLRIYNRVDRDGDHDRKTKRMKFSSQDSNQFDANVRKINVTQAELQNYTMKRKELQKLHQNITQAIAFLSGAVGTGKSRVIKVVLSYCNQFYKNLNIEFNRKTIVVTGLIGCTVVAIHGATVHKACHIIVNKKTIDAPKLKQFEDE